MYSAFDNASQLAGDTDYQTLTDGGTFDAYPLDTSTFARGADLFFANDTYDAVTTGWTRSAIQVDGANAFGPTSVENVCGSGCALPGVPALTVTHTLAPATGDLTINESEPLVKCSPDASTFPPTINTSCTSFVSTGVIVNRTIHQYADGRRASLIDNYVSTDGQPHTLDLISIEDAECPQFPTCNATGYNFPWVDGSTAYNTHAKRRHGDRPRRRQCARIRGPGWADVAHRQRSGGDGGVG